MQIVDTRKRTGFVLIALAVLMASFVVVAPNAARADGGDFGLDFVASAPLSYNHATGGGSYNDRTVGVSADIVEQLEGGDFTCEDTVTYLLYIENSATPSALNQELAFHMSFLADATGQPGVGHAAVTKVAINYGVGDTGISDDGGSTIGTWGAGLTGPLFVAGSTLELDFTVTDMEAGESVVVRVDTTLACDPGSSPTGNLQASLTDSRVISEDGVGTDDPISTGSGKQTIPFKQVGAVIQPGQIIVVKQTLPDGAAQSFSFSSSWGDFSLTDGQSNGSGDLDPGTYSVSEGITSGWELVSATCDNGDPVSAITLVGDETVTCTFTNQQLSSIVVVKQTIPAGATESFTFNANYNASGFSLSDGQSNNSGALQPGTYSVSENVPAGWNLDSAVCDGGNTPANITLGNGELVTCTFTNVQLGTIIVEKQTLPDGSTVSFDFEASYTGDFSLSDGQENVVSGLAAGTYSVDEIVPAGWTNTDVTCTGGEDHNAISLSAGETVRCVFTNTQDGRIEVEKNAIPYPVDEDDSTTFDFSGDITATLGDGGVAGVDVAPGSYSVTEGALSGLWELTGISCTNDASGQVGDTATAQYVVSPGETVRCVFTNTEGAPPPGTITIVKITDPATSTETFTFTGNGFDFSAELGHNDSSDTVTVAPGTYAVSEILEAGWDLTSVTCDDDDSTRNGNTAVINVAPEEDVTCTFTNTQAAEIIVTKTTDPAGAPDVFSFEASWNNGFELSDGGQHNSGALTPGSYSVAEVVPDGWELVSATCSNQDAPASITLAAGQVVTCDFLNAPIPGSIGDYVWDDADNDGVQDPDEEGITAIYVELLQGDLVVGADWTDIDGAYLFDNLPEGDYQVRFTIPSIWEATVQNAGDDALDSDIDAAGLTHIITLGKAQDDLSVDAGLFRIPTGSIGDYVWDDLNRDGLQDEDEPGIAGATVELWQDGLMIDSTTTDADGFYLFDGLYEGAYEVKFLVVVDYELTEANVGDDDDIDSDAGENGLSGIVALGRGEDITNVDAGLRVILFPNSIGDFVWDDLNKDGVQDEDEPGIAGATVELWMTGSLVFTTTTDADGYYLFDGLAGDTYQVKFVAVDGYEFSPADVGDDATDSDALVDGVTTDIVVTSGDEILTIDAGMFLSTATLTLVKVVDNSAEGPFTDQFDFEGSIVATLGDGESATEIVTPGEHTLTELVPEGWALIAVSCDNGIEGDLETSSVTVELAADDNVTCTFTNTNEGTIIIEKVTDVETDEVFTFEIGDETVQIGSGESVELVLPSGSYTITEDLLVVDGWELASIVCAGDSTVDGDSATLLVPPAETVGCTFVNSELAAPLGVIGDYVWNDADADGIQDANESGLAGVFVEVIDNATGDVIISTTSNAAGVYVLANVPEGNYVMQYTVPEPWLFTQADVGSDDELDSDVTDVDGATAGTSGLLTASSSTVLAATSSVGRTDVFFLAAGSVDTSVDAGVYQIAVLPEPPVTNPPATNPPTVTPTPVEDTKVLGIQTTLPDTGFDDWQTAMLALAMIMAGMGLLLVVRKEDLVVLVSGFSDRLG